MEIDLMPYEGIKGSINLRPRENQKRHFDVTISICPQKLSLGESNLHVHNSTCLCYERTNSTHQDDSSGDHNVAYAPDYMSAKVNSMKAKCLNSKILNSRYDPTNETFDETAKKTGKFIML